jgi:hypothetical protein
LEIDTSKHTSIITQNIHKFYISLETLDDMWAAKCLGRISSESFRTCYVTRKREVETHKGRKSRKARTLADLPLQSLRAPAPVLGCCNKCVSRNQMLLIPIVLLDVSVILSAPQRF